MRLYNHALHVRMALCLLLFVLPRTSAAQGVACSDSEVHRTASAVETARQAMLALPFGEGEQETNLSGEANKVVSEMKSSLNDAVTAYMHCVTISPAPDPGKIEKDLSELTHAFRLPAGNIRSEDLPKDFGKFGFELWFEVRATNDVRHLVSIVAGFAIACGSDTMLLVFSPSGGSWEEVLRWQSPPAKTIAGAFEAFKFGISPPDPSGRWYVVAHSISPWCSSTWSSIRYAALRPEPGTPNPKALLSGSDTIWWGNEDFGEVVVQADEFDLRFHSWSIDTGVHNRVYVRHYKVVDDEVTRIQPVAVSPRDFVDEWIVSTWSEASQWSSSEGSDKLRRKHDKLRKLNGSVNAGFSYDAVLRCSDRPEHFQVAVYYGFHKAFFFQVDGTSTFAMTAVTELPDSSCGGANLLDTMSTH